MTTENIDVSARRTGVPWRAVGIFTAIAYGGAWVAMLPLLLSGFERTGTGVGQTVLTQICIAVMMAVPAVTAIGMLKWVHRPRSVLAAVGLTPPRPWGRLAGRCAVAFAIPVGLQLVALLISAAAGTYQFDLVDFSGFRSQFAPETVGGSGLPVAAVLAFLGALVVGMIIWLPMFFGEELGWQGYLFPRLLPLGRWRALVLTSAVVALWHLPTLAMGGQYPGHTLLESAVYMLIGATLLVPILCWLRIRTGSVWPPVFAHLAVSHVNVRMVWSLADAGAGADAGAQLDPLHVGLNGWPGWIAMGAFLLVLGATGQFRLLTSPS
ncbi:CPBP family intramembrane glutamic endopeptidase [Pseudonocardia sp. TRM90224]|uniref:CPBP family intramembrane glutamic endopeptidase n=1 Tax=Pseudonocardia sp. TRM90224 TaxID=2812678 RepID=UPI001E4DA5C9|nr:CPBP family intramembrane glutamic endopeptidase [Pseudonocardia sp. TRM90224]